MDARTFATTTVHTVRRTIFTAARGTMNGIQRRLNTKGSLYRRIACVSWNTSCYVKTNQNSGDVPWLSAVPFLDCAVRETLGR